MSKRSITKLSDLLKPDQRLKLAREDAGYALEEVAAELGIPWSTYKGWEDRGIADDTPEGPLKLDKWRKATYNLLKTRQVAIERHMAWLEREEELDG